VGKKRRNPWQKSAEETFDYTRIIPKSEKPAKKLPTPKLPEVAGFSFDFEEEEPQAERPEKEVQTKKTKEKIKKKRREALKKINEKITIYVQKCYEKSKNTEKLKEKTKNVIIKKASKKVFEDYRGCSRKYKKRQGTSMDLGDFLDTKRKKAIKELVRRYIKNFSR